MWCSRDFSAPGGRVATSHDETLSSMATPSEGRGAHLPRDEARHGFIPASGDPQMW
jgi:hypothetical protein